MTRNLIIPNMEEREITYSQAAKMKDAQLADLYGALDGRIKGLKKQLEVLKDEALERHEKGKARIEGKVYDLEFIKSVSYEYDNKKIYKAIGVRKFLEVVKPVVKKLKEYLAPADLQRMIVETKETVRVKTKKKGGK